MKPEDMDIDKVLANGWVREPGYDFLSARLYNFLYHRKLSLRSVSKLTDAELKQFGNFGAKTHTELNALLIAVGLIQKPTPEDGWRVRLMEAREQNQLTQREVADKVGVTPQTYLSYESHEGKGKGPALETVVRLIDVLQVDAEWLLFGDGGRSKTSKKGAD